MTADPAVLAYLAGIVDADGTIGITKYNYDARKSPNAQPTYTEAVCVQHRHCGPEALVLLKETLGGNIYPVRRRKAQRASWTPMLAWRVSSLAASRCLPALLPYLRVKRAQAENALRLRDLKQQSAMARKGTKTGPRRGRAPRPAWIGLRMEEVMLTGQALNLGLGRPGPPLHGGDDVGGHDVVEVAAGRR